MKAEKHCEPIEDLCVCLPTENPIFNIKHEVAKKRSKRFKCCSIFYLHYCYDSLTYYFSFSLSFPDTVQENSVQYCIYM